MAVIIVGEGERSSGWAVRVRGVVAVMASAVGIPCCRQSEDLRPAIVWPWPCPRMPLDETLRCEEDFDLLPECDDVAVFLRVGISVKGGYRALVASTYP